MPRVEYVLEIHAPIEKVWAFYDSVDSLLAVTPPSTKVTIPDPPKQMREGTTFTLIVRQPPIYLPLRWVTVISKREPPFLFVDEQKKGRGPFASWRHEHHFEAIDATRTRLRDIVTYTPPLGILGRIADALFIRRQLNAMFAYRHKVTREHLEQTA
jgi:ligand-binding SRPBCC domain-containing protein